MPSEAQTPPVGAWDVVLSGSEHGVAQVTFAGDGSLSGTAAFTFFGKGVTLPRRGFSYTNIFGASALTGGWTYDGSTNRVLGYLNEVSSFDTIQITTSGGGPVTNIVTTYFTNGLSFHGKIRPSRIVLSAIGGQGQVTMAGILLQPTNDIGGGFHATVRKPGLPFLLIELFNLNASGVNQYDVTGGGPGYNYTGQFLVSRQRYAAFYQNFGVGGGNQSIAVYAGPFNPANRHGSLTGTDGMTTSMKYIVLPQTP